MSHRPRVAAIALRIGANRSQRVFVLLIGIVVLSLADLAVTLTHLRTVGMIEANPIAAWLIRTTNSPWALSGFKCVSVAICVLLLYHVRRSRSAEIASWCALGILVWMTLSWRSYVQQMDEQIKLTDSRSVYASMDDDRLFLD